MKRRIFAVFGLFLMLSGLVWFGGAFRESNQAETAVRDMVPKLRQAIPEQKVMETEPDSTEGTEREMTEKIIEGVTYVGVLEIPVLKLELPVISAWSNANAKIAPCRYSGSVFRNDLILCAHNYDSHFGRLDTLSGGEAICFLDLDGNHFSYQVKAIQILEGTAVEEMQTGDWDLTLFTCTLGGKGRVVVRCEIAE